MSEAKEWGGAEGVALGSADTATARIPVPAGAYEVVCTKTTEKAKKDGSGTSLSLFLKIVKGAFQGQYVFRQMPHPVQNIKGLPYWKQLLTAAGVPESALTDGAAIRPSLYQNKPLFVLFTPGDSTSPIENKRWDDVQFITREQFDTGVTAKPRATGNATPATSAYGA